MNDFQTVKSAVNILSIISSETGQQMKGKHLEECPFCHGHDCFSIRENQQTFHCFQCSPESHGDVFTFLQRYHNLTPGEALKKAAEIAGATLPETAKKKPQLTAIERVYLAGAEYYHAHMLENGGKAYLLEQRGHRLETLRDMKVGWSDGRLLEHLRSKGFSDKDIMGSGLARESDKEGDRKVFDFFGQGLVVYPHFSAGRVLHFTVKDPKKKRKPYQLPAEKRSKRWIFYNQDALEKYNEIILVEGENDLQSVKDSGVHQVIGQIGQISEEQIKALVARCKSKKIFLWVDNDEAGEKYIRKICRETRELNTLIILYGKPGDDPDSYLQGFEGDKEKEIKRLQLAAIDYISWEILQAGKQPDLEARLKALGKEEIFELITERPAIDQDVYLEKLGRLGFSREALEAKLGSSLELAEKIRAYLEKLENARHANPRDLTEMIFSDCDKRGFTFVDATQKTFFLNRGELLEVANNRPFNSYVFHRSGGELIYTREPGRSTWEALSNLIYQRGRRVTVASWLHADTTARVFHLNFNSPGNRIVKVGADKIEVALNGQNEEGVLLRGSRRIAPFTYLPEANIGEAIQELRELVFDNLGTDKENRYFILCWFLSAFLSDYAPYQILAKFSGGTGSGKTTAARLISVLMFGDPHLGDPSGAAAFSMGANNPLMVIDNLESQDVSKTIEKFLLLAATGGSRQKRANGTDTEVIEESIRALICITSVEPFSKAELINRCVDIGFSESHWRQGFIEQATINTLKARRDFILSGILNLIAHELLPVIETRMKWLKSLKERFKGHSKQRSDEYLSILCLILERITKYIPYYSEGDLLYRLDTGEDEIIKAWIEGQNSKAREQEVNSSSILALMDGLAREYMAKLRLVTPAPHKEYQQSVMAYVDPVYLLEGVKWFPEKVGEDTEGPCEYLDFICQGSDLWSALVKYCKGVGLRVPFTDQGVFYARLRDSFAILKRGGWEIIKSDKPNVSPYYRKAHGKRYWFFRKLVAG